MNLENLTAFAAADLPALDLEGRELLVICVAGRFDLPRAGSSEPPRRSEEQRPPPLEDVYWGDPATSSLRAEGQSTFHRPGTDVYVSGRAWAPRGRPVEELLVGVRVGPCRKGLRVMGDRYWSPGLIGARPSSPRPFESLPLRYEHSLGGPLEPRNPAGRGLHRSSREAAGHPVPNLEDPERPIESPTERLAPAGLFPVARHWEPRRGLAGTYDQAWVERRAPLWPRDLDLRYFHAAAPGLWATPYLEGGEPVVLAGLSPDGTIAFPLPRHRLQAKAIFQGRAERRAMVLDAVHLDSEEGTVTLCWRAAICAARELDRHEVTVVRELEPWEDRPS